LDNKVFDFTDIGCNHEVLDRCLAAVHTVSRRSHWPSGIRRGSTAALLLGFRFRIPPRTWVPVCCHVEVPASSWSLFIRSLTDYGVSEYDREVSTMRRPWSTSGYYVMGGI